MKVKMIRSLLTICLLAGMLTLCSGCAGTVSGNTVAATTLPVYEFTQWLCQGTDITVTQLITESVSCLHDYTLQVTQMRAIESAQAVVVSGAGLEDFLDSATSHSAMIDASFGIELLCGDHHEDEHSRESGHSHENDPHIWLSPTNAKRMAQNISARLTEHFPEHSETFIANLQTLSEKLDALKAYGTEQLSKLSCREMITFHDGFSYFAEAFGLTILYTVEEESGSEASAAELKELISLVNQHQLPAIFTEENGSTSAASVIAAETGVPVFKLSMAMSGESYFDAMYHNIDTLKEALG